MMFSGLYVYHFRDLVVADRICIMEEGGWTRYRMDGVLESVIPHEDISTYSLLSSVPQDAYVNCVRYDCVVDGKACSPVPNY